MKTHSLYTYSKIILIFLSFLVPIQAEAKTRLNHHFYTLKNGLKVVIIPHKGSTAVYHSLWYKVGSADSPPHKHGLAHFLEHLMFNGSQKFPEDTYKRTVNDLGGNQNANTSWDRTVYFVTIAKEYLPLVMEMEADRMQNLILNNEAIAKEKEVVLQERRSTSDAEPGELLREAANASFFWEHPYGKPIIGFEKDIQNYTLEDAKTFYQTWYHPNNAILVIAGDVNINTVKTWVARFYGQIQSKPLPERKRPEEPDHQGASAKIEMRSPRLGSSFQKIYAAPNHRQRGLKTEAILTALENILGNETFGRLTRNLVENQKLAEHALANYTGNFYDPYSFTISAAPKNATDLHQLESSVEAEVRRLISDGVTEEELNKAKEQWQFSTRYSLDSLQGKADFFGENLAAGYSIMDLNSMEDSLQQVTKEEVQTLAKEVLGPGPRVTTYTHNVAQ